MLPIANRVRIEREARGMTQSELGAAIGMTRQTIAAIEQRRYSPSLEAAFRIARLFDLPVDGLFSWDEPATG
jgi:putative transcriptional regulator